MAIVKLSALVSDIRGKVGGNVFSRNKGGAFVRTYVKPINANSEAQQIVRDKFATITQSWKNLTDLQRQSFDDNSINYPYQDSLGNTKYYSGEQLFIKLNSNLQLTGASVTMLSTCSTPVELPINEISNVEANSGGTPTAELTIDGSSDIPAGMCLIVTATTSISAGVAKPQNNLFKVIGTVPASESTTTFDWVTNYSQVFGNLSLSGRVFIRTYLVSTITGQAGTIATGSAIMA